MRMVLYSLNYPFIEEQPKLNQVSHLLICSVEVTTLRATLCVHMFYVA